MRTLAVMAHYDALGGLAPHAERHVRALAEACDRVVVVSTAGLERESDRAAVRRHAELVQRPNYGYDFYSYKVGLDSVGDLSSYDEVVITNDSFVGPLRPYRRILDDMRERPVDVWGMTKSLRREEHVQSFFVAFRPWVVSSQAFRRFWAAMTPESDRMKVIAKYEIGMSHQLRAAGFALGSYFEENAADRRAGRARHLWWARHAVAVQPPARRRRAARRMPFESWNPMAALADRALEDGRLPVVKLDTLRYDPYRLGSHRLLAACEERFPEQFEGVREYLRRTAAAYPVRAGEAAAGPYDLPPALRRTIGYAR